MDTHVSVKWLEEHLDHRLAELHNRVSALEASVAELESLCSQQRDRLDVAGKVVKHLTEKLNDHTKEITQLKPKDSGNH